MDRKRHVRITFRDVEYKRESQDLPKGSNTAQNEQELTTRIKLAISAVRAPTIKSQHISLESQISFTSRTIFHVRLKASILQARMIYSTVCTTRKSFRALTSEAIWLTHLIIVSHV
jgi:hypothetical protein